MSDAEARYRRALRWYPASWREANEDVVLSTLLDVADAERREAPTPRERTDLALHGIRISLERGLPRSTRDRASALALGMGAALAAVYLLFFELDGLPGSAARAAKVELMFGPGGAVGWGPFASAAAVVMVAWIVALVAGMLGGRRVMLAALVVSVVASGVVLAAGEASWAVQRPSVMTLGVLVGLATVAALGDPGRTARRVGWTAISAVVALAAIVGLMLPTFWSASPPPGRYLLVLSLEPFSVAAGLGVLLVVAAVSHRGEWFLAVLFASLPWLVPFFWTLYVETSDGWALFYATLVTIVVAVPTTEWMRRRIRAADARLRLRAHPGAKATAP